MHEYDDMPVEQRLPFVGPLTLAQYHAIRCDAEYRYRNQRADQGGYFDPFGMLYEAAEWDMRSYIRAADVYATPQH